MIKIKYSDLKFASLMCLGIVPSIFFVTWLKAFIGIPLAILLMVALVISRDKNDDRVLNIKASSLIFIFVCVFIWCLLAGQGGFFTQKSDHWARNAIFRDLINYSWPVVYERPGDYALVYYIGHWLIPALAGKFVALFTSFETAYLVARIVLLLWTGLIVTLTVLNVATKVNCNNFKKIAILMTVFVFFSGMDAIFSLISPANFNSHIEWWGLPFQYSSMTTQLFWVYNQSVPVWLAISLFINEKNERNYALIGLLTLPTSPIPMVGLAIFMVAIAIVNMINSIKQKQAKVFFKNVFSIQNILSLVTILPVYGLYYISNTASSGTTSDGHGLLINIPDSFIYIKYVMFVVAEFLILSLLLYKKEHKTNWAIMLCSLLIIPFFRIGGEYDFCMRASITGLFVLMVMLIDFFVNFDDNKAKLDNKNAIKNHRMQGIIISIIFIIGAITPMVEFGTSIRDFVVSKGECVTQYDNKSGLDALEEKSLVNFTAKDYSKSPFCKFIGKK